MSEQVTAIVLAAGAGTRMKSRRAKVLHEIAGRPMLGHALDAVRTAGIDHVVTVVGHDREQVEAAVTRLDPSATIAVQIEQRGTGDAVRVALDAAGSTSATYLVTYADVPLLSAETLRGLVDEHRAHGHAVTILTSEPEDPAGYGRILRDASGAVTAIREHKDCTDEERATREVNSGILVVDGPFLDRAVRALSTDNAQAELYLTDIVGQAVTEGLPVGAHVLEDVWQTEGVNDRRQLVRLGRELNRRTVNRWLAEGVTIVDPETTWIDSAVTIGRDTTILPGTQLLGATTIGEGVTIGPDTTLRDVEVGDDASVVRTHGSDAVVGPGATVGPFAYLRPGAVLDTGSKVGTFVEVKNSHIGPGAKVPHLSYIGDAEVGEGTNLGAGAITANYDGVSKHRTTIGTHVKTGCHNVFVAPVSLGDGAHTGAGTVVREDVAPGALAVPASGQRTIEGWVASRRPGTPSAHAADQTTQETSGGHQQEPQ
ncbi:bifunctional UDP-N-acetylglucosamine diphosphorylase/glucosamine-1-phosphate N-acetyltransferase GlmU [Aeromicrobium tamlense]|uniref:Bifunctional protein GlmU n=1 Tax=Aeromicrobium tamlense TaxID=375541 RepID=A0A8I0FSP5_9ACTN|nr:bifunctional UDP-N-acetylglucosamine diphosphorylase/glucosamine-1-phosphate N-acetyltransferase GlmU [Aeromicrobium tamlense]MBD1269114.1 bifunctional UDP-N-acetylglucosamine diphosphorylase/glucosamine-1-phosphate N-acetyltransferase GlmU [Aeromicrobium tamlense]NYI36977.1 bifunctional UDP-N-acetylglucosamine pyrophosphorylase/glucosamine-1-phosphate N-acetyltransferase [Aeromicrobium tamlense]